MCLGLFNTLFLCLCMAFYKFDIFPWFVVVRTSLFTLAWLGFQNSWDVLYFNIRRLFSCCFSALHVLLIELGESIRFFIIRGARIFRFFICACLMFTFLILLNLFFVYIFLNIDLFLLINLTHFNDFLFFCSIFCIQSLCALFCNGLMRGFFGSCFMFIIYEIIFRLALTCLTGITGLTFFTGLLFDYRSHTDSLLIGLRLIINNIWAYTFT